METPLLPLQGQYAPFGRVADITEWDHFRRLAPPLSVEECVQVKERLVLHGWPEPLYLWPWRGRKILLTGYEVFPLLRRHGYTFRVIEKPFGEVAQALMFVAKYYLARQHPNPLYSSYLRGLFYHEEKQGPGGDRRSEQAAAVRWMTAEALAEALHTKPRTIRRDAALRTAIDFIAEQGGAAVKALLFGLEMPLRRAGVMALAALPPAHLKQVVAAWVTTGRLPRGWRNGGQKATITLPRDPHRFAEVLLCRCGAKETAAFGQALAAVLAQASPRPGDGRGAEDGWVGVKCGE
jgi:hypothetical protein